VHAKIWGARGSIAAPGPETVKYGGNTSCVHIELGHDVSLILDAGTGIRNLGMQLGDRKVRKVHLLLTHLHLDHIQGLGFFEPAWDPSTEVHVWGPQSVTMSLEERLARYLSPPLFPVNLSEMSRSMKFHNLPEEDWEIENALIHSEPVLHQGPTVAYRIQIDDKVLAYIPDHEPARAFDLSYVDPEWISGFSLAEGADVLLHDTQFTEDEYPQRIGWGHSSVADAVAYANITKVKKLVMFHHDPLHTDSDLEDIRKRAEELWDGDPGSSPALAYEGMEIEL